MTVPEAFLSVVFLALCLQRTDWFRSVCADAVHTSRYRRDICKIEELARREGGSGNLWITWSDNDMVDLSSVNTIGDK